MKKGLIATIAVVAAIIIGLGGTFGYNYYHDVQIEKQQKQDANDAIDAVVKKDRSQTISNFDAETPVSRGTLDFTVYKLASGTNRGYIVETTGYAYQFGTNAIEKNTVYYVYTATNKQLTFASSDDPKSMLGEKVLTIHNLKNAKPVPAKV